MFGNCELIVSKYTSNTTNKIGLGITNTSDDYYVAIFETKEEVNELIKKIEKKRDEIFG